MYIVHKAHIKISQQYTLGINITKGNMQNMNLHSNLHEAYCLLVWLMSSQGPLSVSKQPAICFTLESHSAYMYISIIGKRSKKTASTSSFFAVASGQLSNLTEVQGQQLPHTGSVQRAASFGAPSGSRFLQITWRNLAFISSHRSAIPATTLVTWHRFSAQARRTRAT